RREVWRSCQLPAFRVPTRVSEGCLVPKLGDGVEFRLRTGHFSFSSVWTPADGLEVLVGVDCLCVAASRSRTRRAAVPFAALQGSSRSWCYVANGPYREVAGLL